jgi:hypothetical protein
MNRRGFLQCLGLGAAGAAALPLLEKFAPAAGYRTYIMGENAVVNGNPMFVADKAQMPTPELAGWVSYRVHYTVKLPPNSGYRMRYIDAGVE